MSASNRDPMADQTAVYRAPNQAEALQQFAEDSQRARESGYLPMSQEWSDDDGLAVLSVRYTKTAPVAPVWNLPAAGSMPASTIAPKKSHRKRWFGAIAVVVVVGLAAVGGADKDPGGGSPQAADQPPAETSDQDRWTEFAGWATGDLQSITDDTDALSERAGADDVAGAMSASEGLETTATRLLGYMSNHPAAACYAGIFADVRSALTSFQSAGAAGGVADWDSGTTELSSAMADLNAATSGIPAAREACGS